MNIRTQHCGVLVASGVLTALSLATLPMEMAPPDTSGSRLGLDTVGSSDTSTAHELQPSNQQRRRKESRSDQPGNATKNQPGLLQQMTAFKTDVPAHDLDVILVRPTDHSIEVTLGAASEGFAVVEYWREGAADRKKSAPVAVKAKEIARIPLSGLSAGTEYHYRVGLMAKPGGQVQWKEETRFRTRPPAGTPFTFTIQADSHLDQGVEPAVYEQTLANMLAAKPDFVVDLGDTFMTDKRGRDFASAQPQYDAQRWYFSIVAHAAPLFMVLGNHDGEKGTSGHEPTDIGPWSYQQRTSRFPPPSIDGSMYTGSTSIEHGTGSNYYAFEWGDALCIVLDPFWNTTEPVRGATNGKGRRPSTDKSDAAAPAEERSSDKAVAPTDASWAMTLGRAQYDWLAHTLQASTAKYRFVFIHHLVGGLGGPAARGGVESSPFFEWGGANADGSPGFAEHRPGWPMPIHDLLVAHHVSAVFHGHDHLYVNSQRDGLVYQCVPQPGNPRGNTRTAAEYGYTSGVLHGSPGHVRVRVAPDKATVEFVRTALSEAATRDAGAGVDGSQEQRGRGRGGGNGGGGNEPNGAVVHSYSVAPVRVAPAASP